MCHFSEQAQKAKPPPPPSLSFDRPLGIQGQKAILYFLLLFLSSAPIQRLGLERKVISLALSLRESAR